MSIGELRRLEYRDAAEVCGRQACSDQARALLAEGATSAEHLERLLGAGLMADAAAFLAQALRKREAVWWACLCVREVLGGKPLAPAVAEALAVAERWAASPGDGNRRRGLPAAEGAGLDHPAGCVALATHFSGGSLAPPGLPEVKPADHLTGTLVAAALTLASLHGGPEAAPGRYRRFLELGLDVARGDRRWPDPA
jgi:hypothetical protein